MYRYLIKNVLSSMIALIAILVIWPFLALIALLIKIEDPAGPVLFTQKRVGIHKGYFSIYKFRTMRMDTPHDVPTHLLDADKYITRVGRFLRKYSLDELPQVFNILQLKNGMVWVGPRPALWNQYDLIAERDKYGANDVYPGLTGWAQIHGRDELEIPEKAKLDGYYVKHISPIMDLRCIFGTISSVLNADGVVEGGTGAIHRAAANEVTKTVDKKKKVLILTNHSYMLWQFRRELIRELMKDYEVVLSMPFVGHEEDFQKMGLRCIETKIDRRSINPIKDLKLMQQYDKMLGAEKPDLVITYSIKPNIYGCLMCAKHHIRCFANVQGLGTAFQKAGLAQFVSLLYKTALMQTEKVFFENKGNENVFIKRHIVQAKKCVLLPGAGINLENYPYTAYPHNDSIRFLYLGRIMKEKGIDELFEAARLLHVQGYQFQLDLVGFYEDAYENQVKDLVDKGIAVFHGFQENPVPFYQKADCVVLPSYHEGMSNVLLEGAAIGRPLITSNIPGCREAVEHGKTGILCRVKDTHSLYRAMKKILSITEAKREQMGMLGREKMEREFDKVTVVKMTLEEINN